MVANVVLALLASHAAHNSSAQQEAEEAEEAQVAVVLVASETLSVKSAEVLFAANQTIVRQDKPAAIHLERASALAWTVHCVPVETVWRLQSAQMRAIAVRETRSAVTLWGSDWDSA